MGICTMMEWSFGCWQEVCIETETFFELTTDMMRLVRSLLQLINDLTIMLQQIMETFENSRKHVLLRIRPVVARLFDIKDKTKPASSVRIDRSKIATQLLQDNLFYFEVRTIFLIVLEQMTI